MCVCSADISSPLHPTQSYKNISKHYLESFTKLNIKSFQKHFSSSSVFLHECHRDTECFGVPAEIRVMLRNMITFLDSKRKISIRVGLNQTPSWWINKPWGKKAPRFTRASSSLLSSVSLFAVVSLCVSNVPFSLDGEPLDYSEGSSSSRASISSSGLHPGLLADVSSRLFCLDLRGPLRLRSREVIGQRVVEVREQMQSQAVFCQHSVSERQSRCLLFI